MKKKRLKKITLPQFPVSIAKQSATMSLPSTGVTGQALIAQLRFSPARAGRGVELQQYTGSAWVRVASGAQDSNGAAKLAVAPNATGTLQFRATTTAYRGAPAQASASAKTTITSGTPKPSIVLGTLNAAVSGEDYTVQLASVGGTAPLTWSASGLPDGMSITDKGVLSGTPTSPGTYTIELTVTDATGASATTTAKLVVKPTVGIDTNTLPDGIADQDYETTMTASGGAEGYTWTATGLPTGLTISDDGLISGTTEATGNFTVELTVADANHKTATKTMSLRITAALTLATNALAEGAIVGTPYESTMDASGGLTPYSWSATGLPIGIEINTSTGVMAGTPTESGSFSDIEVTVTDDNGYTATKHFTMTVADAYSITTDSLPAGVVGTPYAETSLAATGGAEPYAWTSTTLPDGLTLSASGVMSGTPTTAGTTDITVTLTDNDGKTAEADYTITITAAVHITTTNLPTGVVGTSYTATTLNAADGNSDAYTWTSTTLPDGLTVSDDGQLTGTPTSSGVYENVKFTVTDKDGATAEATFTITINQAVHITTASLPSGIVGIMYPATTLSAADGTPLYNWHTDSLPIGLQLSSDGKLSGTPTSAGVYDNVTITVTDHNGKTAQASYTITVAPAVHITTVSLPDGVAGTSYAATTLTAADGDSAAYSWHADNLPGGLTLDPTSGVLSGTPNTAGGPTQVTITVTDASGATAQASYMIAVTAAVQITTTELPSGMIDASYSATLWAADGTPGYSWTSTTLPDGLSLDASAGTITGVPTQAGTFDAVKITVTDRNGATAEATFTITIAKAVHITTTDLPAGVVGTDYTATVEAADGAPGYGWTSSSLPSGLSIDPTTGEITGTPTQAGTFDTVKITVTDRYGTSAEATFTITIAAAVHITTTQLPDGVLDETYPETTVAAADGTAPYRWSATGLPEGVSLNTTTGEITGTPTESGTFDAVELTVTDANDKTATATLSLTVHAEVAITTPELPTAISGEEYAATLTGLGGTTPYVWAVADLPAGLSLNSSTGAITGTPETAGSVDLSVTLTDSHNKTATATLALTVRAAVHVTTATVPAGVIGTDYSGSIAAGGGTAPYAWASTPLPAGLALSESGALSGTPTADGTTAVTVTVTDSHGKSATVELSITIAPAVHITTTSLPDGVVDTTYAETQLSAADGNTGDYSWASSTLPAGLILSTDGILSGTPTTAGTFDAVKITVTDQAGKTAEATVTIVVAPAVHITTTSLPVGVVESSYPETTLAAADGNGSTYFWAADGLPDGITLNGNTGVLSGIPTTVGSHDNVTITVTDEAGKTASVTFTMVVTPAVQVTTDSLPTSEAGDVYPSTTLEAADGTTPYTWAADTLPEGLTLTDGVISGTPTTAGTTTVTVTVTDAQGKTATAALSIVITPAAHLTSTSLSIGVVGGDYSSTLTADGGTAPYTITAASLPDGLTLADGVISGTPTAAVRNAEVELTVTDDRDRTSTTTLDLTVVQPKTESAGATDTCAVTPSGGVECWGLNSYGQLGDGSTTNSSYPVAVTGLSGTAISLTTGMLHTCALLSSGKVECWGNNAYGQLGNGETTHSPSPVEVVGIDSAVSIAASQNFTCASLADGTASCWGIGTYGQIGNGSSESVSIPTAVNGLTAVMDVESGGAHACALTTSGSVSCWGRNTFSQLGAGTVAASENTPVAVPDVSGATSLSAHLGAFTCAIVNTGTVKCWGTNSVYQLGSTTLGTSPAALTIADVTDASSVAAGGAHTCVVNAAGATRCWGYNNVGQLGSGNVGTNSATPLAVGITDPVASVALGSSHSCARTTTGALTCWGSNSSNQLGDGTTTDSSSPVAVVGFNVATLAADAITMSSTEVGTAYTEQQLSATGGVAPYTWTASDLPAGMALSSDGILSGAPTEAGTKDVSFTVTDARGKTASTSATITIIPAV